jgi:hypothetical protein
VLQQGAFGASSKLRGLLRCSKELPELLRNSGPFCVAAKASSGAPELAAL